jgi:hypothetical protein
MSLESTVVMNRFVIIALCAALAGCSEEEALDNCKRQVEQTVLLRQLALPPSWKTSSRRPDDEG